VALSLLLGRPDFDPSGREIPAPTDDILTRIESKHREIRPISSMDVGDEGVLKAMVMSPASKAMLESIGLTMGAIISKDSHGFALSDGTRVDLDTEFLSQLLFRPS